MNTEFTKETEVSFLLCFLCSKNKFSEVNFLVIVANFCSQTKQRSCVYRHFEFMLKIALFEYYFVIFVCYIYVIGYINLDICH